MANKSVIYIGLKCSECNEINYTTKKNKAQNQQKLELMKYSPRLRKHTLHREVKLK